MDSGSCRRSQPRLLVSKELFECYRRNDWWQLLGPVQKVLIPGDDEVGTLGSCKGDEAVILGSRVNAVDRIGSGEKSAVASRVSMKVIAVPDQSSVGVSAAR